MIAYNKTWLANQLIQAELKKDVQNGCITATEFKNIAEKYPVGFYSPNLFVRVGLFIVTCIVMSFANGLLTLMFGSAGVIEHSGWYFFLGLLSYIALEFMVKANHHFRSGVDDALAFVSAGLFVTGFVIMLYRDGQSFYFPLAGLVFLLNLYFAIRFTDTFMSFVSCIAFFAFVFFGWNQYISEGLATIPFLMMAVSGGTYWLAYSFSKKPEFIYYKNCLIVVQVICLTVLYAAGNYYVIQTLSEMMNGGRSAPLPFSAFFWTWTTLLPLVYIFFGIKRKDVILLRTGLLLIAVAAVTFRNYYHILPIDVTLTILGVALLCISYSIMKYLKTPKHGFTYAEPSETHLMDHLKVESLIIAETFSKAPSAPADDSKFGSGDFGGGGSSDSF